MKIKCLVTGTNGQHTVSAVWRQTQEWFWRICCDSNFTEGLLTTAPMVVVLLSRRVGEGGIVQMQKPGIIVCPFI